MSRHRDSFSHAALGVACGAGLAWGFQVYGPLSKTPHQKAVHQLEVTQNPADLPHSAAWNSDKTKRVPEAAALPALTLVEVMAAADGERLEKLARWLPGARAERISASSSTNGGAGSSGTPSPGPFRSFRRMRPLYTIIYEYGLDGNKEAGSAVEANAAGTAPKLPFPP